MANNVLVSSDFVSQALYDRYEAVKTLWASEAASALFEQLIDLMLDIGEINASSWVIVDNFLVNGQFISREHDLFEGSWEDFCEANGVIFDDNFCCTHLGF
jgi:hypothetical protein